MADGYMPGLTRTYAQVSRMGVGMLHTPIKCHNTSFTIQLQPLEKQWIVDTGYSTPVAVGISALA